MDVAGFSDKDLIQTGFVYGVSPPGVAIGPYDPPEKSKYILPRDEQPEDVWEEPDGIRSRYQAEALLMTEPKLFRPLMLWSLGMHKLKTKDVRGLSAFEVEAILTLISTKHRQAMRQASEPGCDN